MLFHCVHASRVGNRFLYGSPCLFSHSLLNKERGVLRRDYEELSTEDDHAEVSKTSFAFL